MRVDEYRVFVVNHETGHVSLDHTFFVPINEQQTVRLVKVEGNKQGVFEQQSRAHK